METITERIKEIAQAENISIRELEREIGASQGLLQKAIKSGADIQTKWLLAIAEKFPHYSISWLLSGKGEKEVSSDQIPEYISALIESHEKDREIFRRLLDQFDRVLKIIEDKT